MYYKNVEIPSIMKCHTHKSNHCVTYAICCSIDKTCKIGITISNVSCTCKNCNLAFYDAYDFVYDGNNLFISVQNTELKKLPSNQIFPKAKNHVVTQ